MRRFLSLCLILAACATSPDEDRRDDSFTDGSGKADTGGISDGSPDAIAVLHVANTASSELLREPAPDGVGLSDRTVDALLDIRLGDDGVPGTMDDGHFDTLAQLDAVPFIGPIAFHKLLAYAKAHPQATRITVDVTNVAGIAYRDGDGPWTTPEKVGATTYGFDVHGPYLLATMCMLSGSYAYVTDAAATPEDGTSTTASCGDGGGSGGGSGTPSSVHVTGHVAHAGSVSVGYASAQSSVDGWDLAVDPGPGTLDVIATSSTHVLVRRNVDVTADTALPAIDQDTGAALGRVPYSTNVGANEQAYAYVALRTATAWGVLYQGAPDGVVLPPAAVLEPTDALYLEMGATSNTYDSNRSIDGYFHLGDPTSIVLPVKLDAPSLPVSGGAVDIAWTTLPDDADYYSMTLTGRSPDSTYVAYNGTMTKSYLAATHATRLQLPTNVPGIAKLDTTKSYTGEISLSWDHLAGGMTGGSWAKLVVAGSR